jgi:hypothetical protein
MDSISKSIVQGYGHQGVDFKNKKVIDIDFESNFSACSKLWAPAASISKFILVHFKVMGTSSVDFENFMFSVLPCFVVPAAPVLKIHHRSQWAPAMSIPIYIVLHFTGYGQQRHRFVINVSAFSRSCALAPISKFMVHVRV